MASNKRFYEQALARAKKSRDRAGQRYYSAQLDTKYQRLQRDYYKLGESIEEQYSVLYNLNSFTESGAESLERMCHKHIAMAKELRPKWRLYETAAPSCCLSYKRLSMLYEKQGRYTDAANVCMDAIRDGFPDDGSTTMRARLARMVKRSGYEVTEEILQELNKDDLLNEQPKTGGVGLMKCSKCGSENVVIQAVTEVKSKKHGWAYWVFFIWLFDLIIWMLLFLPRLIVQMCKKSKVTSKTRSVAVCQNCGNRWNVK